MSHFLLFAFKLCYIVIQMTYVVVVCLEIRRVYTMRSSQTVHNMLFEVNNPLHYKVKSLTNLQDLFECGTAQTSLALRKWFLCDATMPLSITTTSSCSREGGTTHSYRHADTLKADIQHITRNYNK